MGEADLRERPYLDEQTAQHNADMQVLLDNVGRARLELSVSKVNYYLARAELAGVKIESSQVRGSVAMKLSTLQREIAEKREVVSRLHAMLNDIAEGTTIPEPEPDQPSLKVATRR